MLISYPHTHTPDRWNVGLEFSIFFFYFLVFSCVVRNHGQSSCLMTHPAHHQVWSPLLSPHHPDKRKERRKSRLMSQHLPWTHKPIPQKNHVSCWHSNKVFFFYKKKEKVIWPCLTFYLYCRWTNSSRLSVSRTGRTRHHHHVGDPKVSNRLSLLRFVDKIIYLEEVREKKGLRGGYPVYPPGRHYHTVDKVFSQWKTSNRRGGIVLFSYSFV